jgi:hypothetical protein
VLVISDDFLNGTTLIPRIDLYKGDDTLDFSKITYGITLDAIAYLYDGETITNFEKVIGTRFDDYFGGVFDLKEIIVTEGND